MRSGLRNRTRNRLFFKKHVHEFAPGIEQITERPVRIYANLTIWVVVIFVIVTIAWAALSHIEIVSTAEGKIVYDGQSKTVHAPASNSVSRVNVHEGQDVRKGSVLMELDSSGIRLELLQAQKEFELYTVRLALWSEVKQFLSKFDENAAEADASNKIETSYWSEGGAQIDEIKSEIGAIDSEIIRLGIEARSASDVLDRLNKTLPISRSIAHGREELARREYASRYDYMESQKAMIVDELSAAEQEGRVQSLEALYRDKIADRSYILNKWINAADREIRECLQGLSLTRIEIQKLERSIRKTYVSAPIDGTVQGLSVHADDEVVSYAEVLLNLVPINQSLVVEAFVKNRDRGFVAAGQTVSIRVESYDYVRYGTIRGKVTHVSRESVQSSQEDSLYPVRIEIDVSQHTVTLVAGMRVSVDIVTGSRSILSYITTPVIDTARSGLRER